MLWISPKHGSVPFYPWNTTSAELSNSIPSWTYLTLFSPLGGRCVYFLIISGGITVELGLGMTVQL